MLLGSRNELLTVWQTQSVTLPTEQALVVFEGMRGGYKAEEDKGDIALDNIEISSGPCAEGIPTYSQFFRSIEELVFFIGNFHFCSHCQGSTVCEFRAGGSTALDVHIR